MKKNYAIIRKPKVERHKKAVFEDGNDGFTCLSLRGFCDFTVSHLVKGQAFHSNYLQRHVF